MSASDRSKLIWIYQSEQHAKLNSVYRASCQELFVRNRTGIAKLIDTELGTEPSVFTDFVDDDGHGVGPYAITCTMVKKDDKLVFDFSGTSPQAETSINYYLSTTSKSLNLVNIPFDKR